MTRCYICDRAIHKKNDDGRAGCDLDHFPVPKSLGGTETVPCCLSCHNDKDRTKIGNWDPSVTFAGLSGLWRKAGRDERLVLAKIFHMVSQSLAATKKKTTKKKTKKRQGKHMGAIPFGWKLSTGGDTLIKHPAEQEALAVIRELRERGRTLRAIADELNRRGIRTKLGAAAWKHTSVRSVLKQRDHLK